MMQEIERMKERAGAVSRRNFIGRAAALAATATAGFAGGMAKSELEDKGKEWISGVVVAPETPRAAFAMTRRKVEHVLPGAADYQRAAFDSWREGKPMTDLPDICRPRATLTYRGQHGLRYVKAIGGGLRLWGPDIEGRPLVEAADKEYGRWCAGRLNSCSLEQEEEAAVCEAVIRQNDGSLVRAKYLTLLLPWPNGDVVSVSKTLEIETV
ncbi:hypothetical protein [Nisaea sediminum]|uniref:hypothetical protein n=1 Tax=Nisaea sediminum TaxID=2775867 RepID=UPI001866E96E|nr:hypothetical protein [Nisaea sediminum]